MPDKAAVVVRVDAHTSQSEFSCEKHACPAMPLCLWLDVRVRLPDLFRLPEEDCCDAQGRCSSL